MQDNKKPEPRGARRTFYVTNSMNTRLEEEALKHGVTVSWLLNRVVKDFLGIK